MKKISVLTLLFILALSVFIPIKVSATHISNKTWIFHWVDNLTIQATNTGTGQITNFKGNVLQDKSLTPAEAQQKGDVNFEGVMTFPQANSKCKGERGIGFVINDVAYNSIPWLTLATANPTPTPITSGKFTPPGDCTNELSRALVDYLDSGEATVGFLPTTTAGTASSDQNGDSNATCEASGATLNWILCPVFNGVADFSDWLFSNLVEPMLKTPPISTDPNNDSYKIWSSFRIYGNILLIIALLVLVFGQAIGGGLIDAYTVKKMMPRLLAAAILINLSVYIVALLVDITNVIGGGLGQLMIAPIKESAQFKFSPSGIQIAGIAGGAGTGLIAAYLGGASGILFSTGALGAAASFVGLFVLLPAVLGLIGAFVTLVIRNGLILFLVLISPVAFALYCLPNTEKYFKKWWELLFKSLLVYPIVIGIFAIADIMTVTIMKANGVTNNEPLLQQTAQSFSSILAALIAFVLQFLPLVLIPFAFKFAGGAIGSLYTTISGFGNRGSEAIKGNVNDPNSLRNRTKYNVADKTTRQRERGVAAGLANGASRRERLIARGMNYGNLQARRSGFNKQRSEMLQSQIATGDDSNIRDLFIAWDDGSSGNEAGWYRRMDMENGHAVAGASSIYGDYKTGKMAHAKSMSLYGGDTSAAQDALYYEWKKTGFEPTQMRRIESQYGDIIAEHGFTNQEGTGMMKGVGFRHQGQSLYSKYSAFKSDSNGNWGWKTDVVGMTKEVSHNIDTYGMSKQDVSTYNAMSDGYTRVSATLANYDANVSDDAIVQGGDFNGRSVGQLRDTQNRLKSIAGSLNPNQAQGRPQIIPGSGEGTEPQVSGYGGVSNAPVEVRDAAIRFYETVHPPTQPPNGGGGSGGNGSGIIIPPRGYTGSQG
ncbi:hypothetical protein HY003_01370 [Candidatus Saccharibacteria bacterium]|nr:hypothetical protein [Candidatus Saccharibacteria bacterium]MBI3337928.1 hypothetical protein [Candidatus Saccharibacteria bacterium]